MEIRIFLIAARGAQMNTSCTFEPGRVVGPIEEDDKMGIFEMKLKKTNTPEECYQQVLQEEPDADGVTWTSMYKNCFAEFSSEKIDFDTCKSCKACIFKSIFYRVYKY